MICDRTEFAETALRQSFSNLEVLVPAGTHFDPRVRVGGPEDARGELVARIRDGDTWAPWKLERQVALLDADPELDFCYTWSRALGADGWPLEERTREARPDSVLRRRAGEKGAAVEEELNYWPPPVA